jgi:hypothetical protein
MTRAAWLRPIAFGASILFLPSWVFPIGAGLAKDTSVLPRWWGAADVALAFTLAIAALGIPALIRGRVDKGPEEATYRAYRILIHGIMAVAVLVMLAGDRITWANCATGLLWRTWLGLYILPWWIAAVRSPGLPALDSGMGRAAGYDAP